MSTIETAKAPQAQQQSGLLLDVKDLRVTFKTPDGDVTAVNDLNFLRAGKRWVSSANPVPVSRKPRLL
jgi:oligopeptide transport system ATP-binding protein